MQDKFQSTISESIRDNEGWDEFLCRADAIDLLQSSLWAQLKATVGWRAVRLVIRQNDCIAGGAQVLIRPLPAPLGAVGYVPRGPVLAHDDPHVRELVIDRLRALARQFRLHMLIVQPPHGYEQLAKDLHSRGFLPSKTRVAPSATTRIDLTRDRDEILAQMKSGTRYNIRRSKREGIVVRKGSEEDLTVFSQLHAASSQRQGFSTYSEEYFTNMWRIFAPTHNAHLFISEYEGSPVSAMLIAAFGDTVWAKRFGWSGEHGRRAPNEGLLWGMMVWAKEQGYRTFDQDGIARRAAEALIEDKPLPESVKNTPTYFKLGFGGQALLFPEAFAYFYNPVVRIAYSSLFSKMTKKRRKKIINLLRLG